MSLVKIERTLEAQTILEKIKQSDKSAFDELFYQYYKRLCRFAFVILRCKHTAEEIVQDTFVKLWEKRSKLNISINLDSYLFIMVKNASLNNIKYNSLRKVYHSENEYIETQNSIETFNAEEFRIRLELALAKLPPQCRIIYYLKNMEGLTQDEIACYLNLSVKTVENQLKIALTKLREMLYQYKYSFFTEDL